MSFMSSLPEGLWRRTRAADRQTSVLCVDSYRNRSISRWTSPALGTSTWHLDTWVDWVSSAELGRTGLRTSQTRDPVASSGITDSSSTRSVFEDIKSWIGPLESFSHMCPNPEFYVNSILNLDEIPLAPSSHWSPFNGEPIHHGQVERGFFVCSLLVSTSHSSHPDSSIFKSMCNITSRLMLPG